MLRGDFELGEQHTEPPQEENLAFSSLGSTIKVSHLNQTWGDTLIEEFNLESDEKVGEDGAEVLKVSRERKSKDNEEDIYIVLV